MVDYLNVWYFWHEDYPNYNVRLEMMAHYIKDNYVHWWIVNKHLTLVPKDE